MQEGTVWSAVDPALGECWDENLLVLLVPNPKENLLKDASAACLTLPLRLYMYAFMIVCARARANSPKKASESKQFITSFGDGDDSKQSVRAFRALLGTPWYFLLVCECPLAIVQTYGE